MSVAYSRFDPLFERDLWLQSRREGIGASDVSGLLNMSRWSSPMSIYLDKVGLLDADDETEAMQWGLLLEQAIALGFERRTGLHVIEPQIVATNSDRPWERCTLDGLVVESETSDLDAAIGVLEIKNTSDFSWDEIPDEYAIQVQWQLGITGHQFGWIAALHGGRRLGIYDVTFDPRIFATLRRVAGDFWHDHVLAKNPPAVDGESATTDALKDAYRSLADGTTVDLDDLGEAVLVLWLEQKAAVKREQETLARVENQVRDLLREHTFGAHDGVELVTWKPQATAAKFDREGLERDHPDIAAQYRGEPGTTRVLRPTKALKTKAGIA